MDLFIEEYKSLNGYMPPWVLAGHGREWSVRWGILDALGIQRGELCLTADLTLAHPTILALLQGRLIYRIDLVPPDERKSNPLGARRLGLPAEIVGSHTHPWVENKEFIRANGFKDLPYRKPIEALEVTFRQALVIAATDLNITVMSDQRDIRLPEQPQLFPGGR